MKSTATKFASSAQESMIANALNWRVVGGSGAFPAQPGDVEGDDWLGECKTHMSNANSIYFDRDVWDKIKEEAQSRRKYPVLFTDDGSRTINNTWCVSLSHSFDLKGISILPYTKTTKKNITFDHSAMLQTMKHYKRTEPNAFNKPCAYSFTWLNDNILIMPLSDFIKCCEE